MQRIRRAVRQATRIAAQLVSVAQVLLFLPLTLDIAGKDCMLALSLLLTLSFGFSATLHLAVRNTRLRPLSTFVAWSQPLVIPALLLLTLNLYSSSASGSDVAGPTGAASIGDRLLRPLAAGSSSTTARTHATPRLLPTAAQSLFDLARASPAHWERLLRTLSPVFVILEGLCTLLCIQAMSRFTLARVDASKSPDLARMAVLIVAAGVYVASAYFLWESYGAVPDRISSTLIGVAVTTILFLSGISFSIHKGNVIESSLMLAYAVFQIFHLSSRPEMYTGGLLRHVFRATGTNGHPPLPPVVLQSLDAISKAVSQTFGAGVEFVMAASSALPLSVLVTLFYRIAVLYAATRIVLRLKRQTGGYADDKRLSDEEPAARIMTIGLAYARPLLIAVYTHLLVLSSSSPSDQVFWRWGNVFLVQLLWAIEIRLGQHLDDDEAGAGASSSSSAAGGTGSVGLKAAATEAGVEAAAAAAASSREAGGSGAKMWKGD